MTLLLDFYMLVLVLCAYLLVRNQLVFNYRRKVSDKVFKAEDWEEKLVLYEQVSYGEMVWKFWKPLHSFFDPRIRP